MKDCDITQLSSATSKAVDANSNSASGPNSSSFKLEKEEFQILASQFVPTGHALHYVEHCNSFYAMRWGHIRDFATLDDARKFLVQIGGNHG